MTSVTYSPVEEIKSRIKIEALIAESLTLAGRGRVLTTKEHDSLKVFTQNGTWHQFSRGEGGDIFDWVQRVEKCGFREALEILAAKAGVELRQLSEEERQAVVAKRTEERARADILQIAAAYYHEQLWMNPQAVLYCAGRGWTEETMRRERIGFSPNSPSASGDNKALSTEEVKPLANRLREAELLDHPLSRAVLSVPVGMLVYVHQERGRVTYLSGRSIDGKRHYNLPEEFANGKQVYENTPIESRRGVRILVEGQADAISLGQLGVESVALCGVEGSVKDVSHVAFDNDKAGKAKALNVALGVDPLCRVVAWPDKLRSAQEGANHVQIKDANDLLKSDATTDDVMQMLDGSMSALEGLAVVVAKTKGDERKDVLNKFFSIYCGLDEMVQADIMDDLSKHLCGGKISQFKRLLKAYEEENAKTDEKPAANRCMYSAGGSKGGYVWEQCLEYDAEETGRVFYTVRRPDGTITTQATIDAGGITYVPYPADMGLLMTEVVLLPEKPLEYGSEITLVKEIQGFIHRYLDIDPFYEKLSAYYVLFSWMYDLFENLPYLRALGDYGTGKTRFIMTIGACCYRPMFASGASTTSPLFNMIDLFRGTLIIDEADFGNSDSDAEIIKILNVGYYKKGVVLRSEKDQNNAESDKYWPSAKLVYGPKILATRKPFQDRATESRCLTRRMTSARPRPGVPATLPIEFWQEATQLRNKLLMYRLRNHRPIAVDQSLADDSVEPRLNQVTVALKMLIHDEEMRKSIDTFIRAYNETLITDRQMTLPAIVVQAVVNIHFSTKINILGEDGRDFSMKGISAEVQTLIDEIDPDTKVNPKLISKVLSEELGLVHRGDHPDNRRKVLKYEMFEIEALMSRFGISSPM